MDPGDEALFERYFSIGLSWLGRHDFVNATQISAVRVLAEFAVREHRVRATPMWSRGTNTLHSLSVRRHCFLMRCRGSNGSLRTWTGSRRALKRFLTR